MRLALYSSLFLGFLTAPLNADIIDAVAAPTGLDSIHYSFTLSGFNLLQYEVLDIQFDSSVFSFLSPGFVPPNFDTATLQPGNPHGAPGDFEIEALNPNLVIKPGSLSIDATLKPGHGAIGPLNFNVYQFDSTGHNDGLVTSGTTTDPAAAPEPAGVSLLALGLVAICILVSRRRQTAAVRPHSGRNE